ncbi:MAG TPA: sigma-70 family RNA polymerase sigma factor [Verrucomicrobiae bacterium]|nr:sigma-70 family RNA polymerase sigma factor [Verrucomicrobiae bacterium]
MQTSDDMTLLREFVASRSENAFAAIVARHLNVVYSAALRQVGDAHLAQDVAQAVFIVLARKAPGLDEKTFLTGWLFKTTRYIALAELRLRARRQKKETEAYVHHALSGASDENAWPQIAPLLDAAMARLGEIDRRALLLRYFEGKSLAEVGAALAITEEAARKRVSRGTDKLRQFFRRRGITLTAAALASAVAAHSAPAAPAGLATAIAAVAAKGVAASSSTLALAASAMKWLAWSKYKSALQLGASGTIIAGVAVTAILLRPEQPPVREAIPDSAILSLESPVGGIAVQSDGKIIVGASLFGNFVDDRSGRLGCFERAAIRLNPDGSLDRTFYSTVKMPGNDVSRSHVDLFSDGKILLTGLFDRVDGQARPGYAKLLPDGEIDPTFLPSTGSTNPADPVLERTYLPGGTFPAAALGDGTVAVLANQQHQVRTYRLDTHGRLILSDTNMPNALFPAHAGLAFTLQNAGFWGNWHGHQPVDWNSSVPAQRRPSVRPLGQLPFEDCASQPTAADAAAVLKDLFTEVPLELCRCAVRLPDGGALLAVQDEFINGSLLAPGRFMHFDKSWMPDFSFTNQFQADRRGNISIVRQNDGKFLVAGGFTKIDGQTFSGLARLDPDGGIDSTFHCGIGGPAFGKLVMTIAIQKDRRILIGGMFTTVNGIPCPHLARLNPDGSLDTTFKTPFLTRDEFQARRFPVVRLASTSAKPNPAPAQTPASAPAASPEETILITSFAVDHGVATIRFTGAANRTYLLQAKDSLEDAEWTMVNTNHSSSTGNGTVQDTAAGDHPTRFYRIATP